MNQQFCLDRLFSGPNVCLFTNRRFGKDTVCTGSVQTAIIKNSGTAVEAAIVERRCLCGTTDTISTRTKPFKRYCFRGFSLEYNQINQRKPTIRLPTFREQIGRVRCKLGYQPRRINTIWFSASLTSENAFIKLKPLVQQGPH
jgi:hypothetical protein